MKTSLSILIPTRNEEAIIGACLRAVVNELPDAEIIVIDGGNDGTGAIVRQFAALCPNVRYVKNEADRGKGHAIRVGIRAATGEYIAQFDADLQFRPGDLTKLFTVLERGQADMVLGSRFLEGSSREPGSTPLLRTMGNRAVSAAASLACGQRLTDVMAGIKAWRREVSDSFPLTSDSYTYEMELPIKALRRGHRVKDFPIGTDPRTTGESSVPVWKTGMLLMRDLVRFRFFPVENA